MLHLRIVYCPNLFNKLIGKPELEICMHLHFTLCSALDLPQLLWKVLVII